MGNEKRQKAVVIGGGITGLTAAYYLQKEKRQQGLALDIVLIEGSQRLGGKVQTVTRDGFVIERGPDSFLERKTSAARLVKEVGMGHHLVNNTAGKSYVLVRDKLHPMPGGSVMGIPTQIKPFVTTGLFSAVGKARAAADFVLPKSKGTGDQSLGQFFRRRLGDEVVENLIEPLLSGIYAGDIDQMSLMSTFPQFHQVEQHHRSLILGMKKTTPQKKGPSSKGAFQTVRTGLQSLVEEIEKQLQDVTVMKSAKVSKVSKQENGYRITLSDATCLDADVIIAAVPHLAAYQMFSDYGFMEAFRDVPSTSVATVAMALDADAVEGDLDGTGFVISRNSDYTITACTWTHRKWPHTVPDGKVLLRCYVGRAGDEAVVDLSDDEIKSIVLEDLNKTMTIKKAPNFTVVSRWKQAMPQYTVGHKQRIEKIKAEMATQLPGVWLSGASYEGLGLPDCIDQGEAAVENALTFLGQKREAIRV
ncbi:MAG: protoporphyrinogen oxidase [Bacillus sp. (in: firmicutes)]